MSKPHIYITSDQHFFIPSHINNIKKGCVRDHKLSVRYGFENNISPLIISHPANCEIVLHSENVRRRFKNNDIQQTLSELIQKINEYTYDYSLQTEAINEIAKGGYL